jgi:hypothetical protein
MPDGSKAIGAYMQHGEILLETLPAGRLLADYTAVT